MVLNSHQVVVDAETGIPSDNLTEAAINCCKSLGSSATKVSEILASKDEKIMKAIQEGIDRANAKSVSRAQKVKQDADWKIATEIFAFRSPQSAI